MYYLEIIRTNGNSHYHRESPGGQNRGYSSIEDAEREAERLLEDEDVFRVHLLKLGEKNPVKVLD